MSLTIIEVPLNVPCPVCRAGIGEPCSMGRRSGAHHWYRCRDASHDVALDVGPAPAASAPRPLGELVRMGGDDRKLLIEVADAALGLAERAGAPDEEIARLRKMRGAAAGGGR